MDVAVLIDTFQAIGGTLPVANHQTSAHSCTNAYLNL